MRASGHAAGPRVSEPWVCGTSASLFQLTVKAPLALLVCQPMRQWSESATSSSWVCATNRHLDPLANLMKQDAYLTRGNAFVSPAKCVYMHDAWGTPLAPLFCSSLRLLSSYWMPRGLF